MNFTSTVHYAPLASANYPVLVVPAFENEPMPRQLAEIDKLWRGALERVYRTDVQSKAGEIFVAPSPTGKGVGRVLFIGMGKREENSLECVRQAAGRVAKHLRDRGSTRIAFLVEAFVPKNESMESTSYSLIEGTRLGAYSFTRFKSETQREEVGTIELHLPLAAKGKVAFKKLDRLTTLTSSTILARDWGNTSGNLATPENVANFAQDVAREAGLTCKVLDLEECRNLGMGAFLAVAAGSAQEPKFIVLDYRPKNYTKTLCFVGKTLTFDSGGISIKPAQGMEEMKADKAGGIAVITTMRAVGTLKPQGIRIVGIAPAAENMPGGRATRPGDIVRTQSGKSIEIVNTDAEGRLTLADGLEYAIKNYEPDAVVDIATLTGACVIALGFAVAGMWTESDSLAAAMLEASRKTGERVWRMPLVNEYRESLKSDVADIKNTGTREGGAINAAVFLREFVGDTPWVHLDIAGPAFAREPAPYIPRGATGFGPRLLYSFIEEWSKTAR